MTVPFCGDGDVAEKKRSQTEKKGKNPTTRHLVWHPTAEFFSLSYMAQQVRGRIRCSPTDVHPHYRRREGDTAIICHCCDAALPITTQKELRDAFHESTWELSHWKTLFCEHCTALAARRRLDPAQVPYCMACLATDAPLLDVPTRHDYRVALCAACVQRDMTQLLSLTTKEAVVAAARCALVPAV